MLPCSDSTGAGPITGLERNNVLKESADTNQTNTFAKGGEEDVLNLKFNDSR